MHLPSPLRCGLSLCILLHVSGLGVSPRAGALRGPPPRPLAQPSALLLRLSRAEFGPMPWASWSLQAPGATMGVSQSVVGALQQCKITGGVSALCCGERWDLGMSYPSQGCQFGWELEVCGEQGLRRELEGSWGCWAVELRGVGERAQLFGR